MSANDPNELLAASRDLTNRIDRLGKNLTITQEANRRQRTWIIATWCLIGAVVGALAFTFSLYQTVKAAVAVNEANAVTNCQNANESRRGNSVRWNYVIDVNLSNPKVTDEQRAYLETVRTWFNKLDAARDCSDLGRKYALPDPPPILKRQ